MIVSQREMYKKNIDVLLAASGLLIGILVFLLIFFKTSEHKGLGLPITLSTSCLIYILFKARLFRHSTNKLQRSEGGRALRLFVLALVAFVVLFAWSVSLVLLGLYYIPFLYYILISLMSATIAIEILVVPRKNLAICLVLLQILLLAGIVRWSLFFSFPSFTTWDTFLHADFVESILKNGAIPNYGITSYGGYSSFPLMHILVATFELTSALSLKESFFFSVGLSEIISLLYVFLTSKLVLKTKPSLVATLLFAMSDQSIVLGSNIIPMTLGFGFFLITLYLILGFKQSLKTSAMTLLFFVALILTHTIASFILLVVLVAAFLGERSYNFVFNRRSKARISITTILVFSALLTGYWYASGFLDNILVQLSYSLHHLQILGLAYHSAAYSRFYTPFEFEVNSTGMYVLYWLACIGVLYWLSTHERRAARFRLIAIGVALFTIPYGFLALGLRTILPERWLPFAYVFFAMFSAQGLRVISNATRQIHHRIVCVSIIVFCFTFLMVGSYNGNTNSPFLVNRSIVRYTFTKSEMVAGNTITSFYKGNITTDVYYGTSFFNYSLKRDTEPLTLDEVQGKIGVNGLVVIRQWAYENPVELLTPRGFYVSTVTELGQAFKTKMEESANKVYDSEGAEAYLPVP